MEPRRPQHLLHPAVEKGIARNASRCYNEFIKDDIFFFIRRIGTNE